MKILILNWKDVKNPTSGGAEILTHEIAKRLAAWGNQVTQFSSYFPQARSEEFVNNVRIIRQGNSDIRTLFASVQFRAFLFYKRKKDEFDVVIDEIHGVPFFTPWYVKGKKVAFICEVAADLWIKVFGHFFGTIGRLTEWFYLSIPYKNIQYITISNSTKKDLTANGVDKKNITVLPMGITVPSKDVRNVKKEKRKTLIFVGRLIAAKGVEDILISFKKIKERNKDVRLWIIGRGEISYEKHLKEMANELGIENDVMFFGFVSEREKFTLLAQAHLLIHPSIREGFGLTIPEAGYVGTPVIAYDSPGLRDIVKNEKNGILLTENTPEMIAEKALYILNNNIFYRKLCSGAQEEASMYNWDATAKVMLDSLKRL